MEGGYSSHNNWSAVHGVLDKWRVRAALQGDIIYRERHPGTTADIPCGIIRGGKLHIPCAPKR